MCNLYSMTRVPEAVLRLFQIPHNRAEAFTPQSALFPGHVAPVVRTGRDGARELVAMSWGFVLPQAGRAPRRVTNCRDDRARSSPFWRESFETRRCLVPATSFAEPKQVTPATWHWFALKGEEPRPLFAFAGLWRRWTGPVRKAGPDVDVDVFAFLTTTPNALVATINHERMPVILTADADFEAWLGGSSDDAFELARPYRANAMSIVKEGADKLDPVPL